MWYCKIIVHVEINLSILFLCKVIFKCLDYLSRQRAPLFCGLMTSHWKPLSRFPVFWFLKLWFCHMSENSFNVKFFVSTTSTGKWSLSSLMSVSLPSLIPWLGMESVSNGRSANITIFSFTFNLNFTSSIITCCFFVVFSSFVVHFLFWLHIFLKHHISLSLGEKQATQLHSLLSVHELSCSVINP